MKSLLFLCAVSLLTAAPAQRVDHTNANPSSDVPWTAHWIAAPFSTPRDGAELDGSHPMPVFRKQFTVRGRIASARFRIAGLGQWQADLTTKDQVTPIAPPGLHQAWTDYRKTVTFESYNVTPLLHPGPQVLTIALGNGMYNVQHTKGRYTKFEGSFGIPKLIAELRITYSNGETETIVSDASWQAAPGPTVFSSTYGGEDFDARKLPRISYQTTSAHNAILVDGPGGTLVPAIALEVGESIHHQPIAITHPTSTSTVYDLSQNFAGVPSIHVHGPAGATLKLIPGELLKPDGTVTQQSSGGPTWWTYILRGDPSGETWSPSFGYYGFRYL